MAGLVGYDSSDDDDEVQEPTQATATSTADKQPENGSSKPSQDVSPAPAPAPAQPQPPQPATQASSSSTPPAQLGPVQGPTLGPALGPSLPSTLSVSQAPSPSAQQDQPDPPRSPYSSTRALIHDLTLPPVPNTAIPPSPPGSPPRALTAKFDTFLSLKATKEIHFNARLAESKAVRNPALMDKLLGFVGVATSFDNEQAGEPGRGPEQQYATTLPGEIWDPAALPAWAYKTPLRRAQERAAKERERRAGEPVEFVSASGGAGSRSGTPGTVPPVTGKRKTRFDQ